MAPSVPRSSRKRMLEEKNGGGRRRRTIPEKDEDDAGRVRRTSTAVSLEQSTVMDRNAPYLPQEIFTNMLKRLPVKSLIRFQCVCKDWKNLFKTRSFIAEHFHHSTQQDPVLLFTSKRYECDPEYLCLINRDMQVLEYQTPPSSVEEVRGYTIIGSINGLLCLRYKSSFILWNPATGEVLQVPEVPNLNRTGSCTVGFGFSPIVNDYKIVRLAPSSDLLDDDGVYFGHVFSVSTRSWKEVDVGKLKGIMPYGASGLSFDGAIFWFGYDRKLVRKRFLISFDIAAESFELISIPELDCETSESRLTTYEDKLALLSKSRFEYESGIESTKSFSIDLWVMGKCVDTSGERWNWTKVYSSNPDWNRTYSLRPLTIWRNEIVFFGATEEGKTVLVLCNLHTNEFQILAMGKYFVGNLIWNFAESLASVCDIHIESSS